MNQYYISIKLTHQINSLCFIQLTFQRKMDAITVYMNNNRVAKPVQERVKRWMNYTWAHQNTFDENKVLEFLPLKMRTDIAMRVHFATLGSETKFRFEKQNMNLAT